MLSSSLSSLRRRQQQQRARHLLVCQSTRSILSSIYPWQLSTTRTRTTLVQQQQQQQQTTRNRRPQQEWEQQQQLLLLLPRHYVFRRILVVGSPQQQQQYYRHYHCSTFKSSSSSSLSSSFGESVVVGGSDDDDSTTTTTTTTTDKPNSSNRSSSSIRIVKNLYKNLLRWCDRTSNEIPLSSFTPPITINTPEYVRDKQWFTLLKQYNQDRRQEQSSSSASMLVDTDSSTSSTVLSSIVRRIHDDLLSPSSLPSSMMTTEYYSNYMIVSVHNANGLKRLIQAIFRINSTSSSASIRGRTSTSQQSQQEQQQGEEDEDSLSDKERITTAFQTLKTLNELSDTLEKCTEIRKERMMVAADNNNNNNNERYRIGQVVRHINDRWRGVIVAWHLKKKNNNNKNKALGGRQKGENPSSLTTKGYSFVPIAAAAISRHDDRDNNDYDDIVEHNREEEEEEPLLLLLQQHDEQQQQQYVEEDNDADDEDEEGANNGIQYEVVFDSGDVNTVVGPGSSSSSLSSSLLFQEGSSNRTHYCRQKELELVQDDQLCRIRNPLLIPGYFTRFDTTTKRYVANPLKAYMYPNDDIVVVDDNKQQIDHPITTTTTTSTNYSSSSIIDTINLCNIIMNSIQDIATNLRRTIDEESSSSSSLLVASSSSPLVILQNLSSELDRITSKSSDSSGIIPPYLRFQPDDGSGDSSISRRITIVSQYLDTFNDITRYIQDSVYQRQLSQKHKHRIRFELGDIVQHKVYKFRGIVVGWDPYPCIDVRKWDGIRHLPPDVNPMDIPFYHVIPDDHDCTEIFGNTRSLRYVCDANLEHCPNDRKPRLGLLHLDHLDPSWTTTTTTEATADESSTTTITKKTKPLFPSLKYVAPADVRFRHGEDMNGDDDGITERCMIRLDDELNTWQVNVQQQEQQQPHGSVNNDDYSSCSSSSTGSGLRLNHLLSLLQVVDSMNDAEYVHDAIKIIRKANSSNISANNNNNKTILRWQLEDGINDLIAGRLDKARYIFQNIVFNDNDPKYVEAWNKLATVEYMMKLYDESMISTERVLELDSRHIQAYNGLGLIHYENNNNNNNNHDAAIQCFRTALSLDPWSSISTKLAKCLSDQEIQRGENNNDNK